MLEVNCLEKNFTGFPEGSNRTAPMPTKVESSDDSKDASVSINQTAFEDGRNSRGLLSSKSLTCNFKDNNALSSSLHACPL